eukprot:365984-Chlamydomonas_euryale.AAC.2
MRSPAMRRRLRKARRRTRRATTFSHAGRPAMLANHAAARARQDTRWPPFAARDVRGGVSARAG